MNDEKLSPVVIAAIEYEVENPFTLAGFSHAEVELIQSGYRQAFMAGANWRKKQDADVITWAQACLTALNVGSIQGGSLLHQKLREVMIEFRNKDAPNTPDGTK